MLKGYKILTSFCVICATLYGGAYGAASVRGGATSRAGSIRTLGAGTTASVKATSAKNQSVPTVGTSGDVVVADNPRVASLGGLGGTKLTNSRLSTPTVPTSNQNVVELQQAIEQLRNDYDALGEQYNNLSNDISNVSDTAQVAHETAANNTNTLTVVRSDLSVAKADIEDLKATGGFDEERVQEALDTTLAQRNYATRGELATIDAVARGAVQAADLPQTLNALNIADKDYVASRTQGVVNDSLNITLENYYTKKQVNDAIDVAKIGMVDKNYVDNQIDGLAAKTYVDNRVASIQTGVSEGAVQGIINNSIDTRLGNYYTKGDIDNAIVDAIGAAKDGMADRDYVDNQVRDLASTEYVDTKVVEIESGVDAGTLYNILETRGYKTGAEVQGIVNDSINNTVANYYTKGQVDNAINVAKNGMADRNYVDNQIDGLAPKNWVNTVVDTKVNALPLGLDRDAVKAVVEEYGYKDEAGVQEMINASGHVKTSELPDLIKQWAPGAEIQYADGKLYFVDKDGNDRVVDIRGLDGQDGDQVELQRNGDAIVWRYVSGDDQSWHNLVNMSDLRGADGKSVELGLMNNNLVWKKEGESGWQYLYDLGSITGTDGCGVKAETTNTANGMMVKLLKDCAGQTGDGQLLTQFEVLNGADGTVSEEQIVDALESNPTFMQLKKNVQDLSDGLNNTNSLVNELSDRVDNNTTGLVATNTLANKAWDKVKDLESSNKTAREYVDDRIGDLGYDLLTRSNYASVAAKLGAIGDSRTVAEYIDTQISKVKTSIQVERGEDGITYICKTGNNCTTNPNPYTGDWARISVDVSGYLTRAEADDSFAPIGIVGAVTTAQDAATQAQTQASQAWGKLSDLGGDTVKGYVDNTINGKVGFLGYSLFNGKEYSVADKLGFTATPGTVKEYIDKAVSSVNTKIRVERSPYDGKTYICKNGDTCASQPGPYSTDEWVPVSVDMSGYLTENDADKLYATITALNGVQTTANEAKTAANTAQTSATQAQNAANDAKTTAAAAQTTADKAWGKLESLGSKTVTEYVDEQVNSTGSTIRVETGSDGYTYICRTGTCLDSPSSSSPYWARIELNIPSEYLTETEGNALYALKTQIGELGGSFTSVGAKIGLNDYQYGNTTVKDYVDNKVSNISTTIQVQTSTIDGFTYICKRGSGCTGEPSADSSQWAKVNVDLGNLGTNLQTSQAYNVAQKIGLTDAANLNKTVVGYIGEQIGSLGYYYDTSYVQRPHSVLTYLQTNYTPLTKLGDDIRSTDKTVAQYISDKIGNLGMYWDSSTYQNVPYTSVKQYVDDKFALKTSIGDLGSNGGANYTVAQKIGLNTDDTKNTTVKTYVDNRVGSLGKINDSTYATSVAAKLGTEITNADKTVAGYIQSKIDGISRDIQVEQVGNDTYICKTGNNCSKPVLDYYPAQWAKITIDVSGYLTEDAANVLYAAKSVQTAVEDSTKGLDATYTLASSASAAAATADTKAENAATAAETAQGTADTANTTANNAWDKVKGLNEVSGLSDKTVTGYVDYRLGEISGTVKAYVDNKVESGGVQVETFGNKTYICSNNCTITPPCIYPGQCGWQELNIDVSSKAEQSDMTAVQNILAGFGTGAGNWATVKTYIGDMGSYKDPYSNDVNYTVETKIGLNTDETKNKSVTQYIADKLGFTGDDANKTVAQYVAAHAASAGDFDPSLLNGYATEGYVRDSIGNLGTPSGSDTSYTVAGKIGSIPAAQTIKDYIDNNMPSIDVRPGTADADKNKLYICTKPNCNEDEIPGAEGSGWKELDIASAINLSLYLTKTDAAATYLPQTGLKLHRNGRSIELQQVSGGTVVNYGPIAEVQDLMCDSYSMVQLEEGDDGYVPGAISYTMICNTNGND